MLRIWHEMGAPLERELTVDGSTLELGTIAVKEGSNPLTAVDREQVCEKGCEPWPLVIDRIAVTLSSSFDAAVHRETSGSAVSLAQDAFYRDFEASGMATAIRVHLGRERASQLDELFRDITQVTIGLVAGDVRPPEVIQSTRGTLLKLAKASEELNRKGVTERSRIFAGTSPAFWVEGAGAVVSNRADPSGGSWKQSGWWSRILMGLSIVSLLVAKFGPAGTRRRFALLAAAGVVGTGVLWLNRAPSSLAPAPAPGVSLSGTAPKTIGPGSAAPIRMVPIGTDVVRNHLAISAVWHRAGQFSGAPAPGADEIQLVARIHAVEGNPNGFAKGEWVPYLTIRYSILPAEGGTPLSGTLRPIVAGDGPRYGANLRLSRPGSYRLTLEIEPPASSALGRVIDPADPVAPWWEPFEAVFDWSYPGVS
jgi:uncharacterized protein involved in high-affinity Fe2+ transport